VGIGSVGNCATAGRESSSGPERAVSINGIINGRRMAQVALFVAKFQLAVVLPPVPPLTFCWTYFSESFV